MTRQCTLIPTTLFCDSKQQTCTFKKSSILPSIFPWAHNSCCQCSLHTLWHTVCSLADIIAVSKTYQKVALRVSNTWSLPVISWSIWKVFIFWQSWTHFTEIAIQLRLLYFVSNKEAMNFYILLHILSINSPVPAGTIEKSMSIQCRYFDVDFFKCRCWLDVKSTSNVNLSTLMSNYSYIFHHFFNVKILTLIGSWSCPLGFIFLLYKVSSDMWPTPSKAAVSVGK